MTTVRTDLAILGLLVGAGRDVPLAEIVECADAAEPLTRDVPARLEGVMDCLDRLAGVGTVARVGPRTWRATLHGLATYALLRTQAGAVAILYPAPEDGGEANVVTLVGPRFESGPIEPASFGELCDALGIVPKREVADR